MENINRDFKGVWIPKEVYLNDSLTWVEKILLVEIDSLDNERGCYAGNTYFATFLGVKENTISKSITKLKTLNLIEQVSFDGRQRVIKIKGRLGFKSKAELDKNQEQNMKKIQHNNISNNTSNNISNNNIDSEIIEIKDTYIKEDFKEVFNKWLQFKKDKKQTYKGELSLKTCYNKIIKLSNNDPLVAIDIIDNAIANNWASFYALKDTTKSSSFKNKQELATEEANHKLNSAVNFTNSAKSLDDEIAEMNNNNIKTIN